MCEDCARGTELCDSCGARLKQGEITQLDVDLSRILINLWERKTIEDCSFRRAVDMGGMVLVVAPDKNVGSLIGRGGRVVRLLTRELGKRVRIVNGDDVKASIQDLVAPARVYGINVVYKTDGEEMKVVIPQEDESKITADETTVQEALDRLSEGKMKRHISFVFE